MARTPTTQIAVRPQAPPPLRETPAGKAAVWTASKWWEHKLRLVPLNTAAVAIAAAGVLHHGDPAVAGFAVASTAAIGTGVAAGHRVWRRRGGRALNGWQAGYVTSCGLLLTGYEAAAAVTDPYSPPMLWAFAVAVAAASACWWLRGLAAPAAAPEPETETAPAPATPAATPAQIWAKRIGCTGGPLPASVLKNVQPLTAPDGTANGQQGTVVINADGGAVRHTTSDVAPQLAKIATAFGAKPANVAVEPMEEGTVRLLLFKRNPLMDTVLWPGPGNPGTFTHPAGMTPTGNWAEHQFVMPGWGALHELIVGSTGSGKSRTARLRLAMARHTYDKNNQPVVATWLLDPHQGSSYAGWRDRVDVFARNDEQIMTALAALIVEKDARLAILAASGREVLRPTPATPHIRVFLDEAHGFLSRNPQAGPMLSILVGECRKIGIGFSVSTLYPVAEKLGNDVSIRDGLLTTGTIHRTGNAFTGMIVANGKQIGDPGALPRIWPDGTSAAGVAYYLGGTADHSVMIRNAVGGVDTAAEDDDDAPPFDEAWFTSGTTVRTATGTMLSEDFGCPEPATDTRPTAPVDSSAERPWTVVAEAAVQVGMSTFDRARMFLTELGGPASTGQIAAGIGMPDKLNTVSQALSRAADRNEAVDLPEHGMWALPEHVSLAGSGTAR